MHASKPPKTYEQFFKILDTYRQYEPLQLAISAIFSKIDEVCFTNKWVFSKVLDQIPSMV